MDVVGGGDGGGGGGDGDGNHRDSGDLVSKVTLCHCLVLGVAGVVFLLSSHG